MKYWQRERLPVWELLTLELGLGIRNILGKCSWVPKHQRHPEIPLISTKMINCNSNFSAGKVKNSLEKRENILRWQLLLAVLTERVDKQSGKIKTGLREYKTSAAQVVLSYTTLCLGSIKITYFLPKMESESVPVSLTQTHIYKERCLHKLFYDEVYHYLINSMQFIRPLLQMPGWLQTLQYK